MLSGVGGVVDGHGVSVEVVVTAAPHGQRLVGIVRGALQHAVSPVDVFPQSCSMSRSIGAGSLFENSEAMCSGIVPVRPCAEVHCPHSTHSPNAATGWKLHFFDVQSFTGTVELESGVVAEDMPLLQRAPVGLLSLLGEQFVVGGEGARRAVLMRGRGSLWFSGGWRR